MEATNKTPDLDVTNSPESAAQESIQRALDQGVERGQIHRLHQWATMLNELCHEEDRGS